MAFEKLEEFSKVELGRSVPSPREGKTATRDFWLNDALVESARTLFGRPGSNSFRSCAAIAELYDRDWWSRVWILQEGSCPTETVLFCGERGASIRHFEAFQHILYSIGTSDGEEPREMGRACIQALAVS